MRSFSRSVVLAIPTLLLAMTSMHPTPVGALASAMPFPLHSFSRSLNDVSARAYDGMNLGNDTSSHRAAESRKPAHKHSSTTSTSARAISRLFRRQTDAATSASLTDQIQPHADTISQSSSHLSALASSSDSSDADQDSAGDLSSIAGALKSIADILQPLNSDKGLANYDSSSDLETLLKQVVNDNKDALSGVDTMVYNIPGLGPVLGPIVYQIKCIVDDLLDATESVTDGLLNTLGLQDLLQGLSTQAGSTGCNLGLVGLCLL